MLIINNILAIFISEGNKLLLAKLGYIRSNLIINK